jgi:hypothetical protein
MGAESDLLRTNVADVVRDPPARDPAPGPDQDLVVAPAHAPGKGNGSGTTTLDSRLTYSLFNIIFQLYYYCYCYYAYPYTHTHVYHCSLRYSTLRIGQ